MIQDHDPGDEDREVVPILSVAQARALIAEGIADAKAYRERWARSQRRPLYPREVTEDPNGVDPELAF